MSSNNNNALTSSSSQVLPPREASLFKKILKHFKDKQFKNGLKICNQILSNPKFSEHGETLSMKGLILNSMGKKQEALDYVRRGLKNDVKSHVCWHVFGLLQKADHKYEEAIKCYRNALRLKKDSIQILSDLSLVQIQTRDLEGYRDSRYQLFLLRPGERSTWIGCAMAYHLAGDHMTAVNILSEYQKSSQTGNNLRNNLLNRNSNNRRQNNEIYEHSELLLYHVFILLECNRFDEALQLLDSNENIIVDKVSYYEYKVEIYLALNRFEDAERILLNELIDRNPENVEYFKLFEKSKQISLDDELKRLKMYDELSIVFPRSLTIQRLPLTFIKNLDVFEKRMDLYLKQGFRKGRPALFRDLKSLYNQELNDLFTSFTCKKLDINNNIIINNNSDNNVNNLNNHNHNNNQASNQTMLSIEDLKNLIKNQRLIKLTKKIEIIENLLLKYCENLQQKNRFDLDSEEEESATCLLWVYYFLAQHFDSLKEFSLALYFANQALIHTPTLIDIFVIKAKIFKHSGLLDKAVKCLDEAQSLDTSDRYLNSKCAKYLIRVNRIKEAEDMCLKFTREGVSASENLNEMQCMWYQNEVAKAYKRMGMFGLALMKCIQIDNHFAEIQEDQFDFNTYCILKVTLRAYVKMIRLEDRIKSHRFFITAAKTAIEIYLRLHDCPVDNKSEQDNENNSNLSASELRKMRNKQRKALLKATAEKENDKSQKNKSQSKKDSESKTEEQEFIDPIKLEKTEEPLQDVQRFLQPVKIFGKQLEEIHMLAFEVYYRKGKLLLQLQCLKRAFRCLNESNNFDTSKYYPSLLRQTLLFLNNLITKKSNLNETIRLVLLQELKSMKVFQKHLNSGDTASNNNDDIISRLPTIEEFFQIYLPIDSKSFLIRVENIHAKFLLTKFNQNNQILTNNNDANCNNNIVNSSNDHSVESPTPKQQPQQASDEIQKTLKKLIDDLNLLKQHLSLENCSEFFQKIQTNYFGKISEQLLEELREKLHQLYPFAQCFMNDKQLNEMELELSKNDYFTNEPEEFNCNNNSIEDNNN